MEKRRLTFFQRILFKSLPFIALLSCIQTVHAQRTVGYFPYYRGAAINTVQWSCYTDVFYAFATIDASGNVTIQNASTTFAAVKAKCKPADPTGPVLWLSVGGAGQSGNFATVANSGTARANMVSQLVSLCTTHNLEGIDVDWEFPTTAQTGLHQTLMNDLNNALGSKKLCMAVGGEYSGGVNHLQYCTSTAMSYCDYINIMTYDFPATYNADHSTYANSIASVQAWNTKGGGNIMSKLLIGIPFYGRNASRSLEPGFNELSAANQTTALSSGLADGSYFNSTTTIQNKVDWIKAQGGSGVLIWDMGQDVSGANSLTSIICARMGSSTCTGLPTPVLGADVSFCTTGSITIGDASISTTGRTFSWTRNGSAYTGTTRTISVTTGGTYRLTVTEGSCSKYDEIVVTAYSSVTATGNARCGTGTVALNATGPAGPYQWYDQLTGGNLLNTADAYTTPPISSTTTYYVQQQGGLTSYTTGEGNIAIGSAWASAADISGKAYYKHKITVSQSITLESVVVNGNTPTYSNARIVLYNSSTGAVEQQTAATNITTSPFTFPVNFTIPAGIYYIGLYVPGATTSGAGLWITNTAGDAGGYSIAGVLSIDQNCYEGAANSGTSMYGQLFDWKVKSGASNPCARTAVIATVNSMPATPGTITGAAAVCAGTTGNAYSIAAVSGATSYTWGYSGSGASFTNGTTITPTVAFTAGATSGNLTVTATNSCGTSTAQTKAITINTIPATPGTITGPATVAQGSSGNAYSIVAVSGATSYVWDFTGAGETFTNGTTISPTVAFSGSATSGNITVKASNSCGTSAASSKAVTVTTTTPVTLPSSEKIEAYVQPNPFENDGQLVLKVAKAMKMSVILYDVIGNEKAVIIQNQSITAGDHTYTIPDNLSPGMYIIRIEGDKESQVIKFIKAK